MRFDYYAASIEAHPSEVLQTLAKLGTSSEKCDSLAKAYHFNQGYRVLNEEGLVCTVLLKEGQLPYAFASSEPAANFAEVIRSEWYGRHLVTRMDSAEDYSDPTARRSLLRLMRKTAKARRMHFEHIRKPLDPTLGETAYLGSRKSPYFMRTYDKGWEQYSKLQAQLGRKGCSLHPDQITFTLPGGQHVRPSQWVRTEMQARPKEEDARRIAATCTPEEAWTFTDWSHEFAREAFALDLDRAYIRARKVSKDEDALRWMLRQYRGALTRLRDDLGDWACVGLQLGEWEKTLDQGW
jgi:hypothetical protein